jgi:hypothetical protein
MVAAATAGGGMLGQVSSPNLFAVEGDNLSTTAPTTNIPVGVAGFVGNNTSTASYAVLGQNSGTATGGVLAGVVGIMNPASSAAGVAVIGWQANVSINDLPAVVGLGAGLAKFYYDPSGGGSFSGEHTGVMGVAYGTNNIAVNQQGGYFLDSNSSLTKFSVLVAAYNASTQYKVIGGGAVSTLVKDENNKQVVMNCPEAPEVLFEDYGEGQLVNGEAEITIDPVFSKNIAVNDKHPLRVYIQLEGDCNGVYVTNKTGTGFTVKELHSGSSNVKFSYHVIANRADDIQDGQLVSKYQDNRFKEFQEPGRSTKTMDQSMLAKPHDKVENKVQKGTAR